MRCAHQLLHSLQNDLGVECAAIGSDEYRVSPWSYPEASNYSSLGIRGIEHGDGHSIIDCGYQVHIVRDFSKTFAAFLQDFKPDVVWAQLEGAREILTIAHEMGIQGLLYIHDAEFDSDELRATAKLDCHIVCSSRFLANKIFKTVGRPAQVIYPASTLYFDTVGDPGGYITMINPFRVKGIDTFFEIAKRLPEEKFLLLESWKLNEKMLGDLQARLAGAPNIRFERRVADMRTLYRQTKLLLAPSIWEEGFGMVAPEAQSCRIPVIASARGGLPESVGDGGILIEDYRNIDVWVDTVIKVIREPELYRTLSLKAYAHADSAKFKPEQLARRFHALAATKVQRAPFYTRFRKTAVECLKETPVLNRLLRRLSR